MQPPYRNTKTTLAAILPTSSVQSGKDGAKIASSRDCTPSTEIHGGNPLSTGMARDQGTDRGVDRLEVGAPAESVAQISQRLAPRDGRSEERRVGKECRSR